MGAPKAGLEQGQWSLGLEYSYSDMDLERQVASWASGELFKVEMNKIYLNLGYGINDSWEVFLRLGAADADHSMPTTSKEWKGDADMDLAYGGGLKATFYESDAVAWGALFSISSTTVDGDRHGWDGSPQEGTFELELNEVQIAAGPTFQLTETFSLYGGLFLHIVDGHYEHESDTRDMNEDSMLGGYAGIGIGMGENASLEVEYLYTSDADAICGSFTWGF